MAIIKFKVSRDRCYTIVSNTFINDSQLDAREKGILLVLMSKPDNWEMSVEGLRSFCADGMTSLRKGIQKLEEHGYLLRLNTRNSRGNFGSTPYVVFERPLPEEKRNNPNYNPLEDPELNDAFDISDADRTRWLGLTLGKISAGHRVRSNKSGTPCPLSENQTTEMAAAENRTLINTVTVGQSTVPKKKMGKNTSSCAVAVESYPSYPCVSAQQEHVHVQEQGYQQSDEKSVDNLVDNPVDNVKGGGNACELASPEQVTTLYQQVSDFSRTHSISEAQEAHPAEQSYVDCWVPQRPQRDRRYDPRYRFDAYMQETRRSYTCSRYTPDEYSYVQRLIKERICYDEMCEQYGAERVDTVVSILMEINSAVGGTFKVEQIEISARDMKAHFAGVNQFHVQHMFANLDKHYEHVKCVKSYMRTTLYNAIIAMNEEVREQIRQDCPWLFMKKSIPGAATLPEQNCASACA